MSVSLPHLGVSVVPGGPALIPTTLDLAARGVSLLTGVSLPTPSQITFYLLLEDGVSRIILEDGSGFLKLESAP